MKVEFIAGSVMKFFDAWENITSDKWILETIRNGYKIEFKSRPVQTFIANVMNFSDKEKSLIDIEIEELLNKGAIVPSMNETDQFISNLFLVQKKNGKFRPVLNLKKLNQFVKYFHFKQENLQSVLAATSRNCFYTSLDLRDAYFSLGIRNSDRKYLKFWWKDTLYEFTCLVFGLSTAPRVFTKVMKVVFSHIRKFGISSFFYIDDSLLQDQSFDRCLENTVVLRNLLSSLGFRINEEKSVFIPTQRIIFLGYIIDSVEFKVFLPEEKIDKIKEKSSKILHASESSIREISVLIGLYMSSRCAILLAPLFCRYLDMEKCRALQENSSDYDAKFSLSDLAKQEILWWINNVENSNGKMISYGSPSFYLETDASTQGWGGVFNGIETQGRWNENEKTLHINVLELLAVKYVLFSLCQGLKNCHLCVKSDSATAVHYINNMGGSVRTLFDQTKEIWIWAAERNVFLSAVHIPGHENTIPDNLSRMFSDSSEWKLNEQVFDAVCEFFFTPDIDLFASRINKQVKRFVSWFPDPEAVASDAFSISWSSYMPYIFPPFSVIPEVLKKIEEDRVSMALIVVPMWHTQPWFPRLLSSLIDYPIRLPFRKDLLRLVHNNKFHTMNKRKLFLVAGLVSGRHSKIKEFQNSLETSYYIHGDLPLLNNTNFSGEDGVFGVVNGKLILLNHL